MQTPQSKEPIQKDEEPIQNDAKSLAEEDHQDPEGEIEKLTNRVQASTINPKMAPHAEGHSQSNDLLEEMKEKEEEIKRVQEKLVLVHEELDTEREKAKEYEALGAAQKKALTELESKLRKQQLQEQQLQKTATVRELSASLQFIRSIKKSRILHSIFKIIKSMNCQKNAKESLYYLTKMSSLAQKCTPFDWLKLGLISFNSRYCILLICGRERRKIAKFTIQNVKLALKTFFLKKLHAEIGLKEKKTHG